MAMSASFLRFYEDGSAFLPGAIWNAMQAQLFATLRDFFENTNIWNAEIDINVTPASNVYVLAPPAGTAIKRLLNLFNTTDTTKRWFWPATMAVPGTLVLARAVDQPYTLGAQVALYTLDPVDADGNPVFPTWILDNYFDCLFSGMLWRMYAQPQKTYSNAQLAATHRKLYLMGRGKALADVNRQNLYDSQTWGFPAALAVCGRQKGV
jgi:hypothetical protein